MAQSARMRIIRSLLSILIHVHGGDHTTMYRNVYYTILRRHSIHCSTASVDNGILMHPGDDVMADSVLDDVMRPPVSLVLQCQNVTVSPVVS